MANNVIKPNPVVPSSSSTIDALTMAGMLSSSCLDLRHLVFYAQIVHRTAFSGNTWVIDTGAIGHIVYFGHLLIDFIVVNCVFELPNGETTLATHIGSKIGRAHV